MLGIQHKLLYRAFGMTLSSELVFPELIAMNEPTEWIDVEIKVRDITGLYSELSGEPNDYIVKHNLIMFQVGEMATFCIEGGKIISVWPLKDADEDMIRLFILGTCMGAVLMQRNILPLHGSAVAIEGKAYAVVGESGAGKSTLASAFLSQGHRLLTDDVIAVSLSQDDRIPFVMPSYPSQKLWQDSLNKFGMETTDYRSVFGRETKYSVPVTSNFFTDALPLGGIFELVKEESDSIDMVRIEKLDKFHTMYCHTYRNFFIPRLGLMQWHFQTSASIVNQIELYRLRRPVSGFTAHHLVSLILDTIAYGGTTHDQKPDYFAG